MLCHSSWNSVSRFFSFFVEPGVRSGKKFHGFWEVSIRDIPVVKPLFDCISHHKLLLKLSSYGIRNNLLLWIKSFLTNRSQVVRINSTYSSACSVTSGVIQGSVIGSLLFNLFVNDITDHFNPNTTVKLFADDIKLYTEYTNQTQNNLQYELEKIHVWSSVWQMQISHSKCNILQIDQSQTSQSIHINNIPIQKVNSVMDLGITIDTDLRFKLHINNIISKANQRSALIRRCFLSHNAQNLIRAYCRHMWDQFSNMPPQPGLLHISP